MSEITFIEDEDGYDARACGLVIDIKLAIEDALIEAGLTQPQVSKIVPAVAFNVCNVLDATR